MDRRNEKQAEQSPRIHLSTDTFPGHTFSPFTGLVWAIKDSAKHRTIETPCGSFSVCLMACTMITVEIKAITLEIPVSLPVHFVSGSPAILLNKLALAANRGFRISAS